jgi:hypothetical protein
MGTYDAHSICHRSPVMSWTCGKNGIRRLAVKVIAVAKSALESRAYLGKARVILLFTSDVTRFRMI